MKKFFCFLAIFATCILSVFSFSGCASEVEKVSKNLTQYEISATLDATNMEISAGEKVRVVNDTGTDLNFLCFHLYPRAFRENATIKPYTVLTSATCFPNGKSFGDITVSAVRVEGENCGYELVGEDEDILKVPLGKTLPDKKSTDLEIDFDLKLPNCTHRFGYYENNINLGNFYPILCKFSGGEFDMTPYYATGDPFFSDIANFKVNFTYPSEYALCSTGKMETTLSGNAKTSQMTALAVRDFAMCLCKNAGIVSDKVGDTEVIYMGYAEDENLQAMLDVSKKAVSYFSKTFGDYPYSTLSVVKTPFIYGGMEYPNIVYISDAIDDPSEFEKVIVHEVAHQWWYSVVGNNEATEAWLDESLAEYSSALFFEHNPELGISYDDMVQTALSSYLLYVDVISTLRGSVNTKMNLKVNEYQNDYEYSYMIYVKGVIMFDTLKSMVGENKLVAGLKKYYGDNKFKIATTADFLAAFKSACHKDLDGFFEGYLGGTTIISNLQ